MLKMTFLTILLLVSGGITGWGIVNRLAVPTPRPTIVQGPIITIPIPPTLHDYALRMVSQYPTKLSPTRREVLAEQISRIAESTFKSRETSEAFVLLVAIESAYNPQARSSSGALGLTQVMPKYASSFAKVCGLGEVGAEDLLDAEVNLRVGACQFQELLKTFNGNIGLSLAAYNSGAYSKITKAFSQGRGTDNLKPLITLQNSLCLRRRTSEQAQSVC